MEKNKYKIALLSDLTDGMHNLLKSSVSLAKMVDAEIEVFNVRKPTDIVGKDNQLSAIRTINHEYIVTDKRMKNLIAPFSKDYGVPIRYSSTFGNVKTEISRYLDDNTPNIIVLGRRKTKPFNTVDDRIINFVLSIFKGSVMIVSKENGLEPNMNIGIGTLNCSNELLSSSFPEALFANANSPLKAFSIVNGPTTQPQSHEFLGKKIVDYVFDYNDNTMKKLPIYLSKSKVDLLFVERKKKEKINTSTPSNIYDMVKKLDINLMIAGEKNSQGNYQSKLNIA
ncbi:universal stress protein [Zobellia nedashkovskayae]|uniref:universal stress protein n=1 Tax=Zobellia nedashkovskayae TaxID=2779510 RepID=UPI00188D399A|nr:universal stress protein [Zobellia nedashkovskayae]